MTESYILCILGHIVLIIYLIINFNYSLHRSIPAFCIHRKDWNIVYPFLSLTDDKELEELKSKRSFVAGFTNGEVENRPELYDIFLNGKL